MGPSTPRLRPALSLVTLLALTCTSEAPAPAPTPTAVARFGRGAGPLDFAAVPFPSDLYLDATGHPALGAVPSSRSDDPWFRELRGLLAKRDGFSPIGAVYFGIDGALDPASLPASAAPGEPAVRTGVVVLDVERRELLPLRVLYDAESHLLVARPTRGVTFGSGRRIVAALTRDLRAADGTALGASPRFAAIRDGSENQPSVEEALTALGAAGIARDRVVAATAFTTEHPGRALVSLRAALHATPAPTITVDRVIPNAGESLDDFFGVPAEARPGRDVRAANAPSERGVIHATVARVVLGRFTAPRVLTGRGTEMGVPLRDARGAPVAGPMEDVPFVLVIPRGADVSSLPVLVMQHGFSVSRATALLFADTAGAAGMAVLGLDGYQHGARAEGARDERHDLRGTPGPDGLAEADTGPILTRLFGLSGTPRGMELFPEYPAGAFLQFTADVMSAVRLVRESDLGPLRALDPSLAAMAFHRDRTAYLGISLGSLVGAGILAAEPDLRGVVLNVPLGGVGDTLCEGAGFRPVTLGLFAPRLGVSGSFDEVHRSCANDPIVDLYRWALAPNDPLALAPHYFREPLFPGPRPDALWMLASLDEAAAPPPAESVLAAAGVQGVGEFRFARLAPATLPASGNVATPTGAVTAVAVRCDPCAHSLPEEAAARSTFAPPLDPPLVTRAAPQVYENPIAATHARITRFLTGIARGERATVE